MTSALGSMNSPASVTLAPNPNPAAGETCTKRVYALPGDRMLLLRDEDGAEDQIIEVWEAAAMRRLALHAEHGRERIGGGARGDDR